MYTENEKWRKGDQVTDRYQHLNQKDIICLLRFSKETKAYLAMQMINQHSMSQIHYKIQIVLSL